MSHLRRVLTKITTANGTDFELRIGSAIVDPDGSIRVYLDTLPAMLTSLRISPAPPPESSEERTAKTVIAMLAKHGIRATWEEHLGYLDVRVCGSIGLVYGASNNDWSGHPRADMDGIVDRWWDPKSLPLNADPGEIVEVLIAGHRAGLARVAVPMYRLDGVGADGPDHVTLADFWNDNQDTDADTLVTIASLLPGQTYTGGGGAAPVWSLTRITAVAK